MKRSSWFGGMLAVLWLTGICLPLQAAVPERIRAQLETSMLLSGYVGISPDGTTSGVALDESEALPPGVVQLVKRASAMWRFEPVLVSGSPAAVRTRVQLRVVAKQTGADAFSISLRGATFGGGTGDSPFEVKSLRMTPPRYPKQAFKMGMQGEVFVILRVGRDGAVQDAMAEQVNLFVYGRAAEMDAGRKLLADAALRAAREWTFQPPSEGPVALEPFWLVRVPVAFGIPGTGTDAALGNAAGAWKTYLPGPRTSAPWPGADTAGGSDALVAGRLQMAGHGPRLLTPLGG